MKTKIFSFVAVKDDSIIASTRIAKFVSSELDIPVCWDESIAEEPLDVLIIVNGAYAFSGKSLLEALGMAIYNATRVVWIQNDYTIIPPKPVGGAESPFRKAFRERHTMGMSAVDYWTTVDEMSRPGKARTGHTIGQCARYINWNCLAMDDSQKVKLMEDREFNLRMIYYGAYRKDRIQYFDKYFTKPDVAVVISSPSKKFEQYSEPLVTVVRKAEDLYELIGEFGMGLYLEDRLSHNAFHSPANRFYEMLSVGVPILFEPSCMRTMASGGYEVSDYVLWDNSEAEKFMERKGDLFSEQIMEWGEKALNERVVMAEVVHYAWKKVREVVGQ